jgi:hypothetical protein
VLLAVIGVLNSAISVFYYLRLMVLMYMKDEQETLPAIRVPLTLAICLLIATVATLYPGPVARGLDQRRAGRDAGALLVGCDVASSVSNKKGTTRSSRPLCIRGG